MFCLFTFLVEKDFGSSIKIGLGRSLLGALKVLLGVFLGVINPLFLSLSESDDIIYHTV